MFSTYHNANASNGENTKALAISRVCTATPTQSVLEELVTCKEIQSPMTNAIQTEMWARAPRPHLSYHTR